MRLNGSCGCPMSSSSSASHRSNGEEVEHDQVRQVRVTGDEPGPGQDPVPHVQVDDGPRRRVRLEALGTEDRRQLVEIGCRGLWLGRGHRAADIVGRDGIDRHDPSRLPDQHSAAGVDDDVVAEIRAKANRNRLEGQLWHRLGRGTASSAGPCSSEHLDRSGARPVVLRISMLRVDLIRTCRRPLPDHAEERDASLAQCHARNQAGSG